jgi:hypothetical protein
VPDFRDRRAIKLDRAGFTNFVLPEAGDGVGGTCTGTLIPVLP